MYSISEKVAAMNIMKDGFHSYDEAEIADSYDYEPEKLQHILEAMRDLEGTGRTKATALNITEEQAEELARKIIKLLMGE